MDKAAARKLENERLAIAQYGGGLAVFSRARDLGARTLLDYPIARLESGMRILAEEAELTPAFADSLAGRDTLLPSRTHLARIGEELDLADGLIVGSRFAAKTFDGVVPKERIHTVPYGCDTARFTPATQARRSDRSLRVLFAGQLTQRKGISYLLDAMKSLDPARFSLTLVGRVVGSGHGLAGYRELFRHVPACPPATMPGVFRGADVVVLPSLVEGSAVVVYEAMASGVPVIVTPNAGADLMRDEQDGFVVPIRSPGAIAARLEQLLDPDLLAMMGVSARERALQYSWQRFGREICALCSRLA